MSLIKSFLNDIDCLGVIYNPSLFNHPFPDYSASNRAVTGVDLTPNLSLFP